MLIVETGAGLPDADSYISLIDARALAAKYGWEIPVDDDEAEAALRNGAVYVGLQEPGMCGRRVSATQSLAYPRTGVSLYGFPLSQNTIPIQIIQAQVAAAVEYGAGTDVRGASNGQIIAEERVEGAVDVKYFNNYTDGSSIVITTAIDALKPLMCGSVDGSSFRVFRG